MCWLRLTVTTVVQSAIVSAEALASRVSSQVPSTDLINRFGQATESARIAVEEASSSYKELLARMKAEQQRSLQSSIDDGVQKLETLTETLSRWSTILARHVPRWLCPVTWVWGTRSLEMGVVSSSLA